MHSNVNVPFHNAVRVFAECRDLIRKLLTPAPDERITLRQAMKHPWISAGGDWLMSPAPFPNKLSSDDLDHDVVKHMSAHMDFR